MGLVRALPFQPGLFDGDAPAFDASYARVQRIPLDEGSWVDWAEGWVRGADTLFQQVLASRDWAQRLRPMYDHEVREPRLTSPWNRSSGEPLTPPLIEQMRVSLSAHYRVDFDSVGFNLYRDGHDGVAWHSDHILDSVVEPVIVLVSLGERRRFALRPRNGGAARTFSLGRGDLLVTGGLAQRRWEHRVPKVAHAGPRISLAFRYGTDPRVYARKRTVGPEPDVGGAPDASGEGMAV